MRWIHSTRPGKPFQADQRPGPARARPGAVRLARAGALAHGLATGCSRSAILSRTGDEQSPRARRGLEGRPASGGNLAGCWTDEASEGG